MVEATYIYALTDPRTEEVRYIGKTINEPLFRLGKHLEEARGDVCGYKNNWIRGLLLLGLEPGLSVLEIIFYPESWQEREKWWIAFAREQQYRLTNVSGGGEAGGYARTEETKRKISIANTGRKRTEKTRRRMSLAKKGKPGPKVSKEARRKISEANSRPYPAFINVITGEIIPAGVNLRALCRAKGLGDLSGVKTGRCPSYKNWILLREEE